MGSISLFYTPKVVRGVSLLCVCACIIFPLFFISRVYILLPKASKMEQEQNKKMFLTEIPGNQNKDRNAVG